ncbi:MAG TPA: FAD-dependent monooxygenase, partial [Candidatus Acidoferrales bacterium]|nr:FAD-dependent monooxygenase [Candidatus Acidoferrales bacterium]
MSAIVGKRIAIVGGGPGGLTLARLLQQSGAQVSVYERDQSRSARVQGSALDLHESSGLAALEAAGLIDAFWANHRPDLDRLRLTDAKDRFSTIISAGCPVPGNVLRSSVVPYAIFCSIRFNPR